MESENLARVELRPRPVIDPLSQAYWDGVARSELVIEKCRACGHHIHPPFPECTSCRSNDIDFVAVSGRGRIHQRAIVETPVVPGFEHEVPYVCLTVELDEEPGLIVLGNLIGAPPYEAVIGRSVEVVFITEADGFVRPVFQLTPGVTA
jgi:uncharacterized protein